MVGVHGGHPIYLRDVAQVEDGAEEPTQYVLFGTGAAISRLAAEEPAVTLSVAKRPGSNAITVARAVLAQVDRLKGTAIPGDVSVSITRHYGASAAEKSNELLLHMAIAVVGVSLLVLFMLGWRESIVVAVAIPSTLSLMLLLFHLLGYTLNRVTLFALTFSIGILVDDAIVVVENIVRHRNLAASKHRSLREIAVQAVAEVGNPTVLATLTVIAAILPMAFVGGFNGPYLRPIPVGASAAMVFSLLVAFAVTPWAAARLLGLRRRGHEPNAGLENRRHPRLPVADVPTRWPPVWRWSFLGLTAVLFLGAVAFVPAGWVRVKMLPFDNKSELEIVLNMPEDSSLERTAQVAREIAAAVREEKEVTDYQVYVGTAAPYSFNGLMRHYDLRRGSSVAEVQVNLLPKERAFGAEPRLRAPHSTHRRGHRRPTRRARGGRRGAARASRPAGARRRGVRTGRGDAPAPGRIDAQALRRHARRGRRGLVRRVSAPQGAPRRRQGEGRPPRHPGRHRRPARSGSPSAASRSAICTCPVNRRRSTSCSTCLGVSARASPICWSIRIPDGRGQALVPLGELVRVESTVEDTQHLSQESLARRLRHR